ncbi:NAD-dependent epimerase/dehydratase family protein [Mycolicibacterium sp. Dal123E01]|uniref:NAD-dependent epimerase/dehydratase family protein n=1 Tax=Mycolicibacterium sp. Dal123E01 TaxID=3457578 RepID=UPI00403EF38B
MSDPTRVLVTGGSGFVAGHLIVRLLADGYLVRTTVRNIEREKAIQRTLVRAGADVDRLQVVAADLNSDDGWAAAAADCTFVQHVASPFPARQPANEDDIIVPAREGTLRVLRAAAAAGVRRVVITSSFAAVGYSPKPSGTPYDETDWTDTSGAVSPYVKSKTLAERAAWEFAAQPGRPELAVVNPVGVFGPLLDDNMSTSVRHRRPAAWQAAAAASRRIRGGRRPRRRRSVDAGDDQPACGRPALPRRGRPTGDVAADRHRAA